MPKPSALSVVLVTDVYATIEPVLRALRAQTGRGLEVVIVATDAESLRAELTPLDDFAAVRVVEVESLVPIASARAAGVRAATAPIVYAGETHVFPEAGWAEALIEAHSGPWGAVVPGFENANPASALSWAGFLADYGAWLSVLPPCELRSAPTYNTAYKRAALLESEPLETMLTTAEGLIGSLRASGYRLAFAPSARVSHANVARPRHWVVERYLRGLLVAHDRRRGWSWGRRVMYAAGSPLIPIVCLARIRHGVAAARRTGALSLKTYSALVAGAYVTAAGELVGYLGGSVENAERRMTEYEIHKLRYLSSG